MDDGAVVQRLQRGQHRDRDADGLRRRNRPLLEPVGERLAVEQLHRQERIAFVLANLVELADVRVADGRRRPRLAHEPIAHVRIGRRQDGLERDGAVQHLVDRFVDHAHAAAAEQADDAIVPDAIGGGFRAVDHVWRRRSRAS